MKQPEPADRAKPDTAEASPPPSCGWFELPDIFDGGETERCTTGKPATFRNCGMSVPVCEEHRCRCVQGNIERHERLPTVPELRQALDTANAIIGQQADEMKTLQDEIDRLKHQMSRMVFDQRELGWD